MKFLLDNKHLVEAEDSDTAYRMGLTLRAKLYHPKLSFRDAVQRAAQQPLCFYAMSVVQIPEKFTVVEPVSVEDREWFRWLGKNNPNEGQHCKGCTGGGPTCQCSCHG
jgi:hypothetical protein